MARMGQFAGPSEEYAVPLSFIHPKDNDFAKSKFTDILLDPRWQINDRQRREIQEEIDDLFGLLRLGREKAGRK